VLTYEPDVDLQSSMTTQKQQTNKNKTEQGPRQNETVRFHLLNFEVRKERNTRLIHCY